MPSARTDEEALNLYLDLYLASSMEATRVALLARVAVYASDQCNWLKQQKADAKSPDVLQPFAAFPTFVAQVTEMCNGKVRYGIAPNMPTIFFGSVNYEKNPE
jgi:hypothetical protein